MEAIEYIFRQLRRRSHPVIDFFDFINRISCPFHREYPIILARLDKQCARRDKTDQIRQPTY